MVRGVVADDVEEIAQLFTQLDLMHSRELPWMFRPADDSARDEFVRAILSKHEEIIFVAEVDRLIGFVHVVMQDAPDFAIFVLQRRGHIAALYVSPDWRRRGVGRKLLGEAETWAVTLGAEWLDLMAYEFNEDARGLFATAGYSDLSRRMSKRLESAV
jgi:ribosomal protein S18 acetylase RimI-like enzyme